ncbi:MAG: PhzF family phenazine biosynthesis protein [Actinomycetota bacterium]|nr:PhzF family phenazine biosynthesis protein [Actinomycetota bacterium]
MDFYQLDVFADRRYRGNQLAVFPDAGEFTKEQMQTVASEMNLSETAFVMAADRDSYSVRFFTPAEELPFAGHPTIGTAWLLRRLERVTADKITQRSPAGETPVEVRGELLWFTRRGGAEPDLATHDETSTRKVAEALGLAPDDIGLEARELGRPGHLLPSFSDAGFRQLMVPLASHGALVRCAPRTELLKALGTGTEGAYCFTGERAGGLRARGFFPGVGISEDPATGSAAAALGIYLADRVGDIDLEVVQGVEIGRPSRIHMKARSGEVSIGGRCAFIFSGDLEELP